MSNSIFGVSANSTRVTGMMSGLDTDSLVKGMTTSILNKIAKQQQQKTVYEWKTAAYRDLSSQLISFQGKYLDITSNSGLFSGSYFNTKTTTAMGLNAGCVTVSGTSSSSDMLQITGISSYAESAGFVSKSAAASNKLTIKGIDFSDIGNTVNNLAGKTLQVSYDGTVHSIQFDAGFNGTTNAEVAAAIVTAMQSIEVDENGTKLAQVVNVAGNDSGLTIEKANATDTAELTLGGSALSVLGMTAGDATGQTGDVDGLIETTYTFNNSCAGKSITLDLNGVKMSIKMPSYDPTNFLNKLQLELDNAFGSDRVKAGIDGDGSLTFEPLLADGTTDGNAILKIDAADSAFTNSTSVVGLTIGSSNRLQLSKSLSEQTFARALDGGDNGTYSFTINGEYFEFDEGATIASIIEEINKSPANVRVEYLDTTNRFSVTSTISGVGGKVEIVSGDGNLADTLFGNYTVESGKDAVIQVSYDGGRNFATITRPSNTFDLDGLTISLNAGATFTAGVPITFNTTVDSSDLVSNIVAMVDEFNSIISWVNSQLNTRPDSSYPPLTEEQKSEMSESQIAAWEQKAKAGLLHGDSNLRSLASDLRFIFTHAVPGVGSISDYGITVSTDYKDNGKIVVDQAALKAALEADPDTFEQLFLASRSREDGAGEYDKGIYYRLKDTMDKYVSTTGNKGSLVITAGLDDYYLTSESLWYKEIERINEKITRLEAQLKTAQDRYYKQFTALEKYIAQMSSQSSWLMDQY